MMGNIHKGVGLVLDDRFHRFHWFYIRTGPFPVSVFPFPIVSFNPGSHTYICVFYIQNFTAGLRRIEHERAS